MLVDPGQFRTKLTLQTRVVSQDSVGGTVETWTDGPAVWAKVSPLSAREQWWAQQTHATTTHMVTARYDARIDSTCRLKLGDRVLNIDGVRDVDEGRVYMVISATEED